MIPLIPPTRERNITMENAIAIKASNGPARSSLPHGAGKCPIIYVKLSSAVSNEMNKVKDIAKTAAMMQVFTICVKRRLRKKGVTIPPIIQIRMLKNGML